MSLYAFLENNLLSRFLNNCASCGIYVFVIISIDKHVGINCVAFFRTYALRKIRYEFKENGTTDDKKKVQQFYEKGQETLTMIKRQVILGSLYGTRPLVLETKSKLHNATEWNIVVRHRHIILHIKLQLLVFFLLKKYIKRRSCFWSCFFKFSCSDTKYSLFAVFYVCIFIYAAVFFAKEDKLHSVIVIDYLASLQKESYNIFFKCMNYSKVYLRKYMILVFIFICMRIYT